MNTVTYSSLANPVFTSISRICKKSSARTQDWSGILQNFTKVANVTNPKLKNNPTAFSYALKDILKSG